VSGGSWVKAMVVGGWVVGRSMVIETQQGLCSGARAVAAAGSGGVGGVHFVVGARIGTDRGSGADFHRGMMMSRRPVTSIRERLRGLRVPM